MDIKPLSPLEQEVMNIVWSRDGGPVREIMQQLKQNKVLAYTTVATILQRLHAKGLVIRNDDNTTVVYVPKVTREEYSKNLAQTFMEKFFISYGDMAIISFAESIEKLPFDKRQHLLKLLEDYEQTKS